MGFVSNSSLFDFFSKYMLLFTTLVYLSAFEFCSDWTGLDKIDNVDFLEQMVAYIGKSLAQIQEKKVCPSFLVVAVI